MHNTAEVTADRLERTIMAHSEESKESRAFSHLVVVGSSAGGIEALSRLLGSLPADFPAPVVLAQHTHPERESHLEEILSNRSSLPVKTVAESAPLEAGVVFMVPADRNVNITEGKIEVSEDGHGRPKPSIDLLMTSAAEVFGENLITVVLSGTGTDGTDGARAVKAAGGTVVIQNPESAEFPGMPSSLAPSTVDIVSDLDGIGGVLTDLLSEGAVVKPDAEADEESELAGFLEELKESRGIDFSEYKRPTIRRRLARRFAATGVSGLPEYRRYLQENPEEYSHLINSFLIKVTEFFRTPEQFDYLKDEVLPGLIENARDNGEQLRVWSAGCATGEEAYSLAILLSDTLRQVLGEEAASFDVRIFATDLDEGAVEHARRGFYPASALSGLSEEQVSRYFEEIDGLYYVRQPIRSMIIFGEHDLAQRSPFPRLDLVVSRNVLIYFTPELQRRTLQLFAFSLKDDGYLMLGPSETTSPLSEYFASVDRQHKVFRRRGERFVLPTTSLSESAPSVSRGPAHGSRSLRAPQPHSDQRGGRGEPSSGQSGQAALERLPVGVVEVDRSYDIHYINSAARRLLSIHGEGTGEDLLHLVREAPYDELRAAMDSAFRDGEQSSTGEFAVEEITTGQRRTLRMTCHPPEQASAEQASAEQTSTEQTNEPGSNETVNTGAASTGTATIIVADATDHSQKRRELEESLESTRSEFEEHRRSSEEAYERLKRENEEQRERIERQAKEESESYREQNERLVEGNRQLEQTNRGLRRRVEEVEAANEQHQLSAEEARASVEEVETLNEEMQATNEELETVNEQLQATVEELHTSNEDLRTRSDQLQEMARKSEQEQAQLQAILEGIPEAMLVIEASGEEMFTNAAYRERFPGGCVAADETGAELPEKDTPQGRAARGEAFTMQFTAIGSEGVRKRYEAKGSPVGDRRRRGGVIVFRELEKEGNT